MNAAWGRQWTADEERILREHYADGVSAVAARIGRSRHAVCVRASRLGISIEKHWTAEDDDRLVKFWGERSIRGIAMAFGRTQVAIKRRAQVLGLHLRTPEGFETISAAAIRVGFRRETLRRILAWAESRKIVGDGKPVERLAWSPRHNPKSRYRQHVVESFEVDEAVAAWMDAETPEFVARARGCSPERVRRVLRDAGVTRPPMIKGAQWRIPSKVVAEAFAREATP